MLTNRHWSVTKLSASSGIPVENSGKIWWYYQWYTSGILVVYQWKSVVKFGSMLSTDITMAISGITTVLPVVIPPKFNA